MSESYRGIGFYWMPQQVMCRLFPILQDGTLDTETEPGGHGKLESCLATAGVLKSTVHALMENGPERLSLYSGLRAQIDTLTQRLIQLEQDHEVELADSLADAEKDLEEARRAKAMAEEEQERALTDANAARAEVKRVQAEIHSVLAAARHPSEVMVDHRELDLTLLSLKQAKVALAGPDLVYLTHINYDGQSYSALLKYQGGTAATVEAVYASSEKWIPTSVGLSQVQLSFTEPSVVDVSYVELDGKVYSGQLWYAGANRLEARAITRLSIGESADRNGTLVAALAAARASSQQAWTEVARLRSQIEKLQERGR